MLHLSTVLTPCAVTFSWLGGIAYLKDLDSYADWSFYTPGY